MKKSKKRRLAGCSAGRTAALLAAVLAAGMPVQAADTVPALTVASSSGKDIFELFFYPKGDGPSGDQRSVRNPSSAEMQGIASGWKIWADVLGPGAANREACIIDVVMDSDRGNAHCGSDIADSDGGMTLLGESIVKGSPNRGRAFMDLGTGAANGSPAPVPLHTDAGEIYSTSVHEAGHGLGLASAITSTAFGEPPLLSAMDKQLFTEGPNGEVHLRDVKDMAQVVRVDKKGKFYQSKQVTMSDGDKRYSWNREVDKSDLPEGAFLIGEESSSGVFFRGPATTAALETHGPSGLPGVRINGFEHMGKDSTGKEKVYEPDLSHLELAHSMMSHQNYRNYNFFMEAELAVLKDLGYRIDLKRFYGSSIYGSSISGIIVNDDPFYARSADGRGWIVGQPSEETFGVGLHVYGEGNEVHQRADLLTTGEAAVGVRIDGANTKLTVLSGARIHADGTNGAGLLVAYGKNTDIAVLGDVRARGEGGVAARFDFGGNYLGDSYEMRGSYILKGNGDTPKSLDDLDKPDIDGYPLHLNGPIVRTFNVAGDLEGGAASIYMSENAFVKEINILAGASVKGVILSHWDAGNSLLHKDAPKNLYTALVFGRKVKADGGAGEPDPGFNMTLEGSVTGPKGIDMELSAGRLIVEGETHVHDMKNFGWLGVTGLESTQAGTVSGTFTQEGKDGVLQSWVTPDGSSTYLLAAKGSAQGSWALTPDKGYWVHRKAVPVTNAPVFFRDGTKTAFSSSLLAESSSLTLSFDLLDASGSRPVIGAVRAEDAYSRHATRGSGAEAGRALALANRGVPSSQMQALAAELDFMDSSAAIDRALSQLSADSFSEAFAHALGRQQALSQRLLARMLSQLPKGTAAAQGRKAGASAPAGQTGLAAGDGTAAPGGWTVWGGLFGMADSQSAYGSSDGWYSTGCGLMGGADKDLGDGLSAGFDLALVSDRFEAGGRQDADASSQGLFLGVHGSFAPDAWDGAYLLGGVRFGFDVNRMQRSVSAGAYHRSHDSEWTGWSGAFMLGAGRDWFFGEEKSVRLGPLATIQYAFTSHPDFEEDGGAEALRIDGGTADSLAFLLGAHLGASREIGSGCRLDAELMAGWRHELLEGAIRTSAAFAENPSASFTSSRRLGTRDAGVLQASLRIAHECGFFAELDLGGEARTAGAGVTGGLRVGFEF